MIKFLTKILASRLQQVLPKIICNCQTGYIKGRQIGCSIKTIEDICDCCYERDISGLMLIADIEKAFDSLNWEFVRKTLDFLKFGLNFIKWFDTIYNCIRKLCYK